MSYEYEIFQTIIKEKYQMVSDRVKLLVILVIFFDL